MWFAFVVGVTCMSLSLVHSTPFRQWFRRRIAISDNFLSCDSHRRFFFKRQSKRSQSWKWTGSTFAAPSSAQKSAMSYQPKSWDLHGELGPTRWLFLPVSAILLCCFVFQNKFATILGGCKQEKGSLEERKPKNPNFRTLWNKGKKCTSSFVFFTRFFSSQNMQ